ADVWVNGQLVGRHLGGYDAFHFDITDALKKDGEQELIVAVSDPTDAAPQPRGKQVRKPSGIYYTPTTGIWQTVWLEPVPKAYISSLKIVPDINEKRITVTANCLGTTDGTAIQIKFPSGLFAIGEGFKVQSMKFPGDKLWTPESPTLYDFEVNL